MVLGGRERTNAKTSGREQQGSRRRMLTDWGPEDIRGITVDGEPIGRHNTSRDYPNETANHKPGEVAGIWRG